MLNNSQWIPTGHWQKSSWKQNCSKYYHITRLNKRRRKKNKKESRHYLCPWGRAMKEESSSQPMNDPPSLAGRSTGKERELQRLEGECNIWIVAGRTGKDQFLVSWPPFCTQPETHVYWCGVECWNIGFSEENQREDWGWLHRDKL